MKNSRSNVRSARQLALRRETIRALRQVTPRELRAIHSGMSADDCDESTLQPWTAMCD